jgi:hypothetical protein
MSSVIDIAAWRRRRQPASDQLEVDQPASEDPTVARLEHAIQRLHRVISLALDGRGRLEPKVETELLAIMGELTVGLVTEAASRAERLADRLAAGKGGVGPRTSTHDVPFATPLGSDGPLG